MVKQIIEPFSETHPFMGANFQMMYQVLRYYRLRPELHRYHHH
jgi:hypothetical protein